MNPDKSLPPAPSLTTPKAPTSRRALSLEVIVDAAMKLLDAEGLQAVTMRRVAEELGTGPASLYAHVASKVELQDALLERVIGEFELVVVGPADWREQTKQWLRGMRATLSAHRDIAGVAMGKIPLGPNSLAATENLLALLRAGGLDDRTVALAADLLPQYIVAGVYERSIGWASLDSVEAVRRYVMDVREYLKALPPERFPALVDLAGELTAFNTEFDERFEFGLEVLLAGLEAHGKKK